MTFTTVKRRMIAQFHHPHGLGGRLSGFVMAHRPSNRRRNVWAVALLDVRPTDRVLEVGFGPGIAVGELARRVTTGRVYGVDHSRMMVDRARRRNAAAVRTGRVVLRQAAVDRLPDLDGPLDAILAVNTVGFWPDPTERLRELRGLLRPGGRIALVGQPRVPGATAEHTARAAAELTERLTAAGFVAPRVETLDLDPPVACVLARAPGTGMI